MTQGLLLIVLSQLFRISMQLSIGNKRKTETWEILAWSATMLGGVLTLIVSIVVWAVVTLHPK